MLDTTNEWALRANGEEIVALIPLPRRMDHDTALRLAAWLVVMANNDTELFEDYRKAILES